MNEKRACELLLPAYLLFNHVKDDRNDRMSRAITNYLGKHLMRFCNNDSNKAAKISKRIAKNIHQIERAIADNGLVRGKKLVLVTNFLTQIIFKEKDGKLTDEYVDVANVSKRLVEFVTKFLLKNIDNDDLDQLSCSAEKQARKIFNNFYLKV
jgi:hypothetical protein